MDTGHLHQLLDRQRAAFLRDGAPPRRERLAHLRALEDAVFARRKQLYLAVEADFGTRAWFKTIGGEVVPTLSYIRYFRRNLRRFMAPEWRPASLHSPFARIRVVPQPLGVVGVMSSWNYPVMLALMPVAAALAAGNRVLVKVSEHAPATGAAVRELLAEAFPPERVAVVEGGPGVGDAFSRLPLDHLFFTGSSAIARHIVRASAEHLVPLTLELGGKSPGIVGAERDLESAAERVAFSKLFNAGQSCVAVDYALVPRGLAARFAERVAHHARRHYPGIAGNPDYTAIITDRQYQRLEGLLADARARGATLRETHPEERPDPVRRLLPPVLVPGAAPDLAMMGEEIFGPILPILEYDTLDDAIAFVNARPRPLTLHWFGGAAGRKELEQRTTSGQLVANDVLWHFVQEEMRFGGVGESGMGAYHGPEGFFTFSHRKSVFIQPRWNPTRLITPPFPRGGWKDWVLKFFLRF
jgi:coniferyl-aldehyde dehydrogenase